MQQPTNIDGIATVLGQILGDAIVAAAKRPDVAEALRSLLAGDPAPLEDTTRLLSKAELAKRVGKSPSTVDRLDREGAPHSFVGDTKRYSLAAYLDWLQARGKRGTKAKRGAEPEIDVSDVAEAAGLARAT